MIWKKSAIKDLLHPLSWEDKKNWTEKGLQIKNATNAADLSSERRRMIHNTYSTYFPVLFGWRRKIEANAHQFQPDRGTHHNYTTLAHLIEWKCWRIQWSLYGNLVSVSQGANEDPCQWTILAIPCGSQHHIHVLEST